MFYHHVILAPERIMGKGKQLPWPLFQIDTCGHTNIMSKQSFESFGHKLYFGGKVMLVSRDTMSLEEALTKTQDEEEVYIVGGLSLYEQTMDFVQGIAIVQLLDPYAGNVHYPPIPQDMKLQFSFSKKAGTVSHFYERTA